MLLSLPDASTGIGDGLTDFEEYRGFVLNGRHRRTNPFFKDYFLEADVFGGDIQFAYPRLPTSTHLATTFDYSSNFANDGFEAVNPNWAGLPGASGHVKQKIVHVVDRGFSGAGFGGETVCAPGSIPHVPLYCSEIHVFTQNIQTAWPSDPIVLRRAIVAHEAGHSVNFFDNGAAGCLMYGGALQTTGTVPTNFCYGINTTLVCGTCTPPTNAYPVFNFNETDTLRLRQ